MKLLFISSVLTAIATSSIANAYDVSIWSTTIVHTYYYYDTTSMVPYVITVVLWTMICIVDSIPSLFIIPLILTLTALIYQYPINPPLINRVPSRHLLVHSLNNRPMLFRKAKRRRRTLSLSWVMMKRWRRYVFYITDRLVLSLGSYIHLLIYRSSFIHTKGKEGILQ